jgi:para-nitrobenzyl esterase
MKTILTIAILISFAALLNAQVAETQFGKIQGKKNGNVSEFLGIPFAKPPVDSLRWKAPKNPESWPGILQTTDFAPVCPQKRFTQGDTTFTIEGEEDCLYLNIWTPDIEENDLPVLVFIHGGGNQQGGASNTSGGTHLYSGKNMASRGNAVIVTIQYRLGPLGFLVHPGLEAENKNKVSGNYAVLDQILALQWIQNNIESFGGNPSKVMIFGESAGGVNVGNLLSTNLARGLFQRACIQSASPVINDYRDSRDKGIAYVDRFTTSGSNIEKIGYMRTLPADSLLHFDTSPIEAGVVQMNWQPVVDKFIFHDFPIRIFESGNFNKVPLIIGSNADEMSLSAPQTVFPIMVTALIKSTVPSAFQKKALELYPPGTNSSEARNSYVGILTDAQFTVNARRTARCVSLNQNEPVWRYFFTHKHTIPQLEIFGSYHGMELFYVFNNWENTILGSGFLLKPEDQVVQDAMLKYWVNFANTGNPNGDGLENWPEYRSSVDNFLEISANQNGTQSGLRAAQCDLWDDVTGFTGCSATVSSNTISGNDKKLRCFPNPTAGIFHFQVDDITNAGVFVFNSSGQRINVPVNSNQIDLRNQKSGIYFVEIKTNKETYRGRIVKTD